MNKREREELASLWHRAVDAGKAAAKREQDGLPPENRRGLDCGWAWVMIRPARGPLVSYLKSIGIGQTVDWGSAGRGYWVRGSAFSDEVTQSYSVEYAGAATAARILKEAGIRCYAAYRLD